jgi:hypothetical protein
MAKKKTLRRKKDTSFGSSYYDHTNLPLPEEGRTGVVVHLTLEEGLKLQLSLQQALWELNRLDRRSPASREKSVALTLFPAQKRIMVNMGTLKYPSRSNLKEKDPSLKNREP